MNADEDREDQGKDQDMEDIKSQQSLLIDNIPSEEEKPNLLSYERGIAGNARPHGDCPESKLVPGEEIASEAQEHSDNEDDDTDNPVELPWRLVGTCVEHPAHVQEDKEDHGVCRPVVHVPQEHAVGHNKLQVFHIIVSPID